MKRSLAALFIVLAVAAAYAPAAKDGFVWDDTALVLRDPLIRSWRLIPEGFNHFLFVDATASDFYRPIQRLTYTAEYALFAFQPIAYHLTNIVLHTLAAVALFLFADELLAAFGVAPGKRRWAAFIGALIWAIHPVHTAAVVYVSGRADLLGALFGFAGCYLLLRSNLTASRGRVIALSAATGCALLLSALSKESGLIFFVVAPLLTLWAAGRRSFGRAVVIVLFAATIYFTLRLSADHTPAPAIGAPAAAMTRPLTMARAIAEYSGLVLFPLHLHMDRDVNAHRTGSLDQTIDTFAWREMQTLLGVVILAMAICWAIRVRKRDPIVFRLLALSALTYLPVSGVMPLNASVAEHWIYLPTAFFFIAATLQLQSLVLRERFPILVSRGLAVALSAWLLFLGVRTALRTLDWKDQRTFLERNIAAGGDSARMWINLGGLEMSEGHLDRAKADMDKALEKEPDQPLATLDLGIIAMRRKDFARARTLAQKASETPWVEAQAHELLAVIEYQEKGTANPLRLRLASRTGAPNWEIEKRYVRLIDQMGGTDAAIRELQGTLRTEWYRAESWQLLGELLRKRGKMTEASWAEEEAVAYDVHLQAQPARL